MNYYSLYNISPRVDFKQATVNGLAPDKGLYFPEVIPRVSKELIKNIEHISEEEIAFQVMLPFVGNSIPKEKLAGIIADTLSFPFPLVSVTETISALELFHGPTMAFKDVGARFMARCLGYFLRDEKQKVTVLVATSGDTGGAVADGFYDVDRIDVVILYPEGKVSKIQEMQLTTHGNNIRAISVKGSFDDCQAMVKQAFNDSDLHSQMLLTSANSINIARWLPQQFYYFFAWKYWQLKEEPPVISVPSGNFGNICAGLLAKLSGLPIRHFIAACNSNDVLTNYLQTGVYASKLTTPTISNAMDVGDPSNLRRVMELCGGDVNVLKHLVFPFSCSTVETQSAIERVYTEYHYLTDPHGAVAFLALEQYLNQHPDQKGIFLETAHPVKFSDVMEPIIKKDISIPPGLMPLFEKVKISTPMTASFSELKSYLMASGAN